MSEFKASGFGKNFFVYKYKNYDISLPRTETKTGFGHRAFDVEICNEEKLAAKRRDFTINSVMINIFNGEVVDSYGGIKDIKNQILKVVDEKSFVEDSLRVLRAVQFVARFNLIVDEKSLNLMKSIDLSDLSNSRISDELRKLFNANFQHLGLDLIYQLEIFKFLFLNEISKNDYLNLRNLIKNGTKFIKDERYFLYKLLNYLKFDKLAVLKRLNLNSVYKKILNEPYFDNPTMKNLLEISLKMPLKQWLGLDSENLINLAKKLKIYENKFNSTIKSKDVISDGFSGKDIGEEIYKRQILEIDSYLESFKA